MSLVFCNERSEKQHEHKSWEYIRSRTMFFSDYFDSANLCGSHRNIVLNIFLDNTEYFIIHLTKNSSSVCLMESWEHRLEGRFFFSLIQSWVVPQLGKASFVWVLKSTKGGDFHHLPGYLDQCCITILVKKFFLPRNLNFPRCCLRLLSLQPNLLLTTGILVLLSLMGNILQVSVGCY